MDTKLFIQGNQSQNGEITCPLPSSVILFIAQYCQQKALSIVFVSETKSQKANYECCTFKEKVLSNLSVSFTIWDGVPELVRNVSLPSLYHPDMKLIRSGLCAVLRHIIKQSHYECPSFKLIDLLGFRCGSMKMCAEVSSWTKLCEVDLPTSVTQLMVTLRDHKASHLDETCFTLPSDLMKLEGHFMKKCLIHNSDKKQRAELIRLKNYFSGDESSKPSNEEKPNQSNLDSSCEFGTVKLDALSLSVDELYIEQTLMLNHGIRKYRAKKQRTGRNPSEEKGAEFCNPFSNGQSVFSHISKNSSYNGLKDSDGLKDSGTAFDLSELQNALDTLVYTDIEYVHVYSEGAEMTVADLILFIYIYYLLEMMEFECCTLLSQLPCVMKWASHMTSIPTVMQAGLALGLRMTDMKRVLSDIDIENGEKIPGKAEEGGKQILFRKEEINENEDVELSRNTKMKHKAIKPEVIQVLNKFESNGLTSVCGSHPKGDKVQVDWDSLPDGVHPKEGDVPLKRTVRKCQQLENLSTAVQAIAKPGNVVVDFCSGGGHLGIVLAYLLPECQVFLVENKEESLLKSCSRLKSLGLNNVTLYQCNMDYFIGKFDVGTCLHACGSATDMVLQLCLQSDASFVICPCCYGSIQNTHLLSYPRSKYFFEASVTYKDFLTLGHAADQTEFNIALEEQGRKCMQLIDTDRAHFAKESDYTVSLCSLKPLTCTPKNNLLIGSPNVTH